MLNIPRAKVVIPRVSVVTPCYNSAAFIGETIESVRNQSVTDWEHILIDDGSSDGTADIVRTYADRDRRIKLIELGTNSGAAVARNTGINAACGRYLAFLDSDDVWLDGKLAVQLEYMTQNAAPFSFTAYYKIDEEGRRVGSVGVPSRVTYQDMLKTSYIGCLTAIYDTAYFGKIEMPLVRRRQDYGLWLQLLKKVEGHGIHQPLALYRQRSGSISSNKARTSVYTWRVYREIEGLSLLSSAYYFSHYAVRGVLRSRLPALAKRFGLLHAVAEETR
jgi:teichuronic acid biosynthesis glycosyltransferase TuaG